MSHSGEQLERLISRYLDDECSLGEKRELRQTTRDAPSAAALFEEHAALDRELAHAMRTALGRSIDVPVGRSYWRLTSRFAAIAVAACLVAMVWIGRPVSGSGAGGNDPAKAGSGWFASSRPDGDTQTEAPLCDSPYVPIRQTARHWIVIPGGRAGEYMVIEVDRVQTRAVAIHEDF